MSPIDMTNYDFIQFGSIASPFDRAKNEGKTAPVDTSNMSTTTNLGLFIMSTGAVLLLLGDTFLPTDFDRYMATVVSRSDKAKIITSWVVLYEAVKKRGAGNSTYWTNMCG
jgi:hypothetical protein